jgi:hypothetical protein
MILNNELENMLKKTVMARLVIKSWYLPGGNDGNDKKKNLSG